MKNLDPFKGPFKGDIDTGIVVDVDMDTASNMAVSIIWGSFKRGLGLFQRLWD